MPDVPDIIPFLRRNLREEPVAGETYTLYGNENSVGGYYRAVADVADRCLILSSSPGRLLMDVQRLAVSRRRIRMARRTSHETPEGVIVRVATERLSPYTGAVGRHCASLSWKARWDRTLAMTEEQYHLAMLSIELANRFHGAAFRAAATRLAFLPHCLRDMNSDCRAEKREYDEVCRGCTKSCWLNGISKLLRLHDVSPYIWMTADLNRLIARLKGREGGLGILGIACVPELARGIRMCMRHGVPVVGIPLNANRCARWMGQFHDNSVSLEHLRDLLRVGHAG